MTTITVEQLRQNNACEEGIDAFLQIWPGGVAEIEQNHSGYQAGFLMFGFGKWLGWLWAAGVLPQWSMEKYNLNRADLRGADLRGAIGYERVS